MRFRAIEVPPGELLVDEVTVDEAVSRIAGIATVEALLLFTSRMALDLFMEGFLPDGENPVGERELEAAFERELRAMAGVSAEEAALDLRFPVFGRGPSSGDRDGVLGRAIRGAGPGHPAPAGVGHGAFRDPLGGHPRSSLVPAC